MNLAEAAEEGMNDSDTDAFFKAGKNIFCDITYITGRK